MKVVTHSGVFHADDVIAYLILNARYQLSYVGSFRRTRDQAIIDAADIAFDVGGVCDPENGRYDHHQRGGAGTRSNGVPYAAAGLIWRRYGFEFCERYAAKYGIADTEALELAVDESVIQGIDALDNGDLTGWMPKLSGTNVKVDVNTLSALVSSFNPASLIEDAYPEDFNDAFMEAANAIWPFFERLIIGEVNRLKGESIVRSCDHGDAIMVLDPFCQWQEIVIEEMPHVQFVVFRNPEGTWMVQVVPIAIGSFDARKPLPAAWAGLRDDAFSEATGVGDAVFCHPARFICGAKSRTGAHFLAEQALGL